MNGELDPNLVALLIFFLIGGWGMYKGLLALINTRKSKDPYEPRAKDQ